MDAVMPRSLLIMTGSMGSGKTAVMAEASDILALHGIPHAAVDLDMLGLAHLPESSTNNDVMYRNLQAVVQNYSAVGVNRFLLARAIESRVDFQYCVNAVAAMEVVVCRLTASIETMRRRVGLRELGIGRDKYIERVISLNETLDHARLENFAISNEDRPLANVAKEVLERAGWLQL
jgi:hypothetical protein